MMTNVKLNAFKELWEPDILGIYKEYRLSVKSIEGLFLAKAVEEDFLKLYEDKPDLTYFYVDGVFDADDYNIALAKVRLFFQWQPHFKNWIVNRLEILHDDEESLKYSIVTLTEALR